MPPSSRPVVVLTPLLGHAEGAGADGDALDGGRPALPPLLERRLVRLK